VGRAFGGGEVRVVVADDHGVVRLAVRLALEAAGFAVVGEAGDVPEVLEVVARTEPHVCLLDVHMPGNGLQAARRLATLAPDVAVVMFTVSADEDVLFEALRLGVAGFLPKDMDLDRLGPALHGVLRGEAAIPRTLMARVLDQFQDRGRAVRRSVPGRAHVSLTSREAEVLDLLLDEATTAEISSRLFVSPATVRTHVTAILRKFGVADRAGLVSLVRERRGTSALD
jgi:DNA-binding NarL/FixJ family response regulator